MNTNDELPYDEIDPSEGVRTFGYRLPNPMLQGWNTHRPTHRCNQCGAYWKHWQDDSWTLCSSKAGACCDNARMGPQIVQLDAPAPAPATSETPRTDEQWERHDHETIDEASARCRHFARTLERELAAAKRERDEANARLVNSIKHLNRLGSWAQQDPTGPFESAQIQQWVLSELRAALGQDYEPTKWQPSILMLRDQLSAATRRAEEAERELEAKRKHLRDANRGAECNAKVAWGIAKELAQVQAERDEAIAQRADCAQESLAWREYYAATHALDCLSLNDEGHAQAIIRIQAAFEYLEKFKPAAFIIQEAREFVARESKDRSDEIIRLRTAGAEKWQPIESAERTTRSILVWCPENRNIYCVYWRDGKWMQFGGGYGDLHDEPTHWMALPAPPAIGRENS